MGGKMSKGPRSYTQEFKKNAVRLVQTSGKNMTEIARSLDIATTNLHRWRKQYASQEDLAALEKTLQTPLEEVQRLRIEIEILRQERDILKRAVSIFSREHR